MSLALIEEEIRRFLKSSEPEVLCIMGKWGVGKTYAWKKYLIDAQRVGEVGLETYSYVSLFGLNSLEDLRFSIFENSVTGKNIVTGPDISTFNALFNKGTDLVKRSTDLGRKMRPVLDAGFAFFNRKGIGDLLLRTAFLAVRKQLICLDDLERAGDGLRTRDALGLTSFLKEDRGCKVVLLLNDEQMKEEDRAEFSKQLEKVADTTLIFDLSPDEAVEVAFPVDSTVGARLKPRIIELGITNIRVIKKIERLAIRLFDLLNGFSEGTLDQAAATLALGGWSVQQPDIAPPLAFIRQYNSIAVAMRKEVEPTEERWRSVLNGYPYTGTDALDSVILDGTAAGYFDEIRLKREAEVSENQRRELGNAFSKVWQDLYHGSLATEDDEFFDALHQSSIDDAKAISPNNINSAIRILREYGRGKQADEIIAKYIEAMANEKLEFFNIETHHFAPDDPVDEAFREAFAQHRRVYVDTRNPIDVLRSVSERQSWDESDVVLMAKQTTDDFERIFETLRGTDLRRSIYTVLTMGRSGHDESEAIRVNALGALERIAAKSPLRRRKILRYGIVLGAQVDEQAQGGLNSEAKRH